MCFIQEADYEWGGPGMESFVSSLSEPLAKLARASRRWRINLSEGRKVSYSAEYVFGLTFPDMTVEWVKFLKFVVG